MGDRIPYRGCWTCCLVRMVFLWRNGFLSDPRVDVSASTRSTGVKNFLQNRLPPSRKLGKKLSLRSRICQSPPTSAEVGARKKLGYRPSRKLGKKLSLRYSRKEPPVAPTPTGAGADRRSFPSEGLERPAQEHREGRREPFFAIWLRPKKPEAHEVSVTSTG